MCPPTLAIQEPTSHTPAEQRVIVQPVSWTTYEQLLVISRTRESRRPPDLDPGIRRDDVSSLISMHLAARVNMHNTL